MDPDITLRPATLRDYRELMEIETLSFTSDRLSSRQMRYLLTRARAGTWVAIAGNRIAGYCTALYPAHPRPARIYSLAVRTEFRGHDIAKAMLNKIIATTKERDYVRIRLEVSTKNRAAQSLYAQLGFRTVTQLPGYYEDESDGVRLQLDIVPDAQSASIHL